MKSILWGISLIVVAVTGCNRTHDVNADGYACLGKARAALCAGDTKRVKALVDSLRSEYPMALNAREDAILLLDSANLTEAHEEVSTLEGTLQNARLTRIGRDTVEFNLDEAREKVRFFEKKISVDKAKKKTH